MEEEKMPGAFPQTTSDLLNQQNTENTVEASAQSGETNTCN